MHRKNKPMDYQATKDKALRLLTFRAHSEFELRQKLKMAGSQTDDIEKVMEFLTEYKLIDDESYARHIANDYANIKKFGKKRIYSELINKGIDRELCDLVLLELDIDEEEMLIPQMRKKLNGDFEQKSRDRAFRYFVTRGFGFDDIKHAFETVKNEEEL